MHSFLVVGSFIKRQSGWTPDSLKMMFGAPPSTSQFSEEKDLECTCWFIIAARKGPRKESQGSGGSQTVCAVGQSVASDPAPE